VNLRKTVEAKKAEEIARLEKSKNPKKQAKAEELKKKTRIDHIKIVTKGGKTTYLQLENSTTGFLGGRSYPYDEQNLKEKLHELCQKHGLSIKDVTEIAVYQSTKVRKNFILGSLWGHTDLYSAAFYIGTTKRDNPSRIELMRSMRRQPSRNNQPQAQA